MRVFTQTGRGSMAADRSRALIRSTEAGQRPVPAHRRAGER